MYFKCPNIDPLMTLPSRNMWLC